MAEVAEEEEEAEGEAVTAVATVVVEEVAEVAEAEVPWRLFRQALPSHNDDFTTDLTLSDLRIVLSLLRAPKLQRSRISSRKTFPSH